MNNELSKSEIYIRPLALTDTDALTRLRNENRSHLDPFEPLHSEEFYTREHQEGILRQSIKDFQEDRAFGFGIFGASSDSLVGRVNLSNVVRGAWQSCTIGYFIDHSCSGRGWMTEAAGQALHFAFETANLHRVQAAVMPRNQGSIRVVEKNGLLYEGLSKYYLQIFGHWEDHHIYSITRETWEELQSPASMR